jgi:threonine/homoserine/homoserine lactone efflux protein
MMAHVTAISLLYQSGLVLAGNKTAIALKRLPSARKVAARLAGMALIGFGLKLATSDR